MVLEGQKIPAGAARALDDLDLLPLGQDDAEVCGEGLDQIQQVGLLLGACVPRIRALDAGGTELFERD